MPISSTINPRTQYAGSGTSGPFSTSFIFINEDNLKVIKTDSLGNDTTLILTTDYTVSGGGSGGAIGSVLLTEPLESNEVLTILRVTPLTQETDYIPNDRFPAETHEQALNKLTLISQELNNKFTLSLQLPESSTLSNIQLPPVAAGDYLRWNSAGTNLETASLATLGIVTAGTGINIVSDAINLNASIGLLNDVDIVLAEKGDILVFDGTDWIDLTVGTDDQTLVADSSAASGIRWTSTSAINLVGDTTPQLGGDLDLNSNNITGTGNINITGNITVTGTIDGRDLDTDGAKLDSIATNADVTTASKVTAALDGASLSSVSPSPSDKVLLQDASDSNNLKSTTVGDLISTTSPTEIVDITELSASTPTYEVTGLGLYKIIKIFIYNWAATSSGDNIYIRLSTDNGVSFIDDNVYTTPNYLHDATQTTNSNRSQWQIENVDNSARAQADFTIIGGSEAAQKTYITGFLSTEQTQDAKLGHYHGVFNQTNQINAIQIYAQSGDISSDTTFVVVGLK